MKQRINKFIYAHKRLNALFWWVTKRAVFEVDVYEDAKIIRIYMDLDENVIVADIEAQSIKKAYAWQKDDRNVQE